MRIMNVEQIFQMRVWKPNVEEVFIIKKEGTIQSVDFTRTSVIDVWYEVIKAEINFEINMYHYTTLLMGNHQPDVVLRDRKYSISNMSK